MRARYYNVDIKHFINQDVIIGTIDNSKSLNRYAYVQGNPISLVDPFGLSPYSIFSKIGHSLLDVVGFIPVIGDVVDIANGIWYMAEGDYGSGASCFVSALPLIGSFIGNGIKLAFKGLKGSTKAAKLIKTGFKVAGGISTLYRAASSATETVLQMYDKYIVNGQVLS